MRFGRDSSRQWHGYVFTLIKIDVPHLFSFCDNQAFPANAATFVRFNLDPLGVISDHFILAWRRGIKKSDE